VADAGEILDPALGSRSASIDKLSEQFIGVVLELTPQRWLARVCGEKRLPAKCNPCVQSNGHRSGFFYTSVHPVRGVRKLPRQADISKVELLACRMRYSAGVSPPSASWGRAWL